MTKIRVGETIAKTYSFAFKHAPTNFAVAWIPLLLATISAQVVGHFYPPQVPPPGTDPATAFHMVFGPPQALLMLLTFVCIFAQLTLFTREALGLRKGSAFLQNPLGAGTGRVMLAILLLLVAFIAIYIAVLVATIAGAVAVGLAAKLMPTHGSHAGLILAAVIAAAIVLPIAWIYVVLRLGFLLVPIAIAEEQISLGRAGDWRRGNVGRRFLERLSVIVPFFAVDLLFVWFLTNGHLFPPIHAGMKPDEIMAWRQQYGASMQNGMRTLYKFWYLTAPLNIVASTIIYGLFAAPAAFAYRALTAENAKS